jgi:hypothetical protein
MQAAFTFTPSGSRTGTITTTVLGTGSAGPQGSNVLYLDRLNAVGSNDSVGDGTLIPLDPNLQFRSASSSNGIDPGPFYDNGFGLQSKEGWASPYVGGTSPFFGMFPTNDPSKDVLLVDGEVTGALIIPDQYTNFVFGISSSVAIGQPVTLYFEYPLQYNFVGVTVNNTADTGENGTPTSTGINYTTLWQQVEAITMNWVDKTGTTVSLGSYQSGQPVPVTVAPLSPTLTAVYVTGNPVPIIGIGSGENAPFNTTASANSNQNYPVITSPGVNVDFTYNEFNALIDNAVTTAGAEGFYDLDYTQGAAIPVNYQTVISASQLGSGSSTLAPVQSYNWNVRRSILPRYSGSKAIGLIYNFYTPPTGSWPGDQSFGKDPVINYYGNIAFNIDYVQGTYPEMSTGTALNVKNIGIFQDTSKTEIVDQNTPAVFNFLIDQYLGFSQSAQIFSNDVSPIKDNSIRTLDGAIGWPANSTYFIPRQQTFGNTYGGVFWTGSLNGIIFCSASYNIFPQIVDDNNRYATASLPTGKTNTLYSVASASYIISQSILNGSDWYITLYTGSIYPLPTMEEAYASGGLSPYNSGSVYNYSTQFSLAGQGVYKITNFGAIGSPASISTNFPYLMTLDRPLPDDVKGIGSGSKSDNSTGLSMLIWKSNPFPQPVIVETRPDYFPSGIGERGGYAIPVDFNTSMKSSLSVLQNTTITPQVTTTGTTTVSLPTAPGTGGTTTTGAASAQTTNLYLPVGRKGISNGEQVVVDNKTYIWDEVRQRWIVSPSSGGSGTAKGGL